MLRPVSVLLLVCVLACAGPAPVAPDLHAMESVVGRTLAFEHPRNWPASPVEVDAPAVEGWLVEPSLGRMMIVRFDPPVSLDWWTERTLETQRENGALVGEILVTDGMMRVAGAEHPSRRLSATMSTAGFEVVWTTELAVVGDLAVLTNGPEEDRAAMDPGFERILASVGAP